MFVYSRRKGEGDEEVVYKSRIMSLACGSGLDC